jgi:TetR/AcrR family transcriptional repressor of nem operon
MIARTDQKQETRRRIVDAATTAIRDNGLVAPSVNGVMSDAGLTVGGFYAHFENRDALMLEALSRLMAEHLDVLAATVPSTTAVERRQVAARYYLSRKHRDGQIARCPLPTTLSEFGQLDPRYRDLLATHLEHWADVLGDADTPDSRREALAAIATMVGALTLARALGPTVFSDELLAAAKADIGASPPTRSS